MKVKIITRNSYGELENCVNYYVNQGKVIDVKYSVAIERNTTIYSAMIIYEVEDER